MNRTTERSNPYFANHYAANELALSLAEAESALRSFTQDRVDAIVDGNGKTYLLRPAQEHFLQKGQWSEAVIESVADVVTVVDRQGQIRWQNGQANRVLGYEKDDLIGTSIFDLIEDHDLPVVHSAFFNVIEGIRENATVQYNHRVSDGSYRLVEATLAKMCSGQSPSVVFSLRSIAHQTRSGIEFEKSEAESALASLPKDRFLAMLAHELRTPLMPVLLCLGELQADERFAQAGPLLAMMRRNLDLQCRLLEELADFTTVGQHKVRLRPEPIDVHEAVRFVLEICKGEIAAARIDVGLDLRATNITVFADSLRLQQVMWNLVRNAVKFSPPGSSITISSANETAGGVTLKFIDHGIGIEPELLPLVFEPFKQGERVINTKQYGGLGLGLFIAKGLTEAQKGSLVVSSEGLGLGATFRLTLKLAADGDATQGTLPLFGLEPPTGLPHIRD